MFIAKLKEGILMLLLCRLQLLIRVPALCFVVVSKLLECALVLFFRQGQLLLSISYTRFVIIAKLDKGKIMLFFSRHQLCISTRQLCFQPSLTPFLSFSWSFSSISETRDS